MLIALIVHITSSWFLDQRQTVSVSGVESERECVRERVSERASERERESRHRGKHANMMNL